MTFETASLNLEFISILMSCPVFRILGAKISTCADWNFWETETGNQANFIKATNGKIYFGNRQDLNDFEKAWMKFGFGANVQCMNMDEWVEYVISKVSSDTPSRHHIEV